MINGLWRLILAVCCCSSLEASETPSAPTSALPLPALTYFVIENQARPLQIENDGLQHRGIVSDLVFQLSQDLNIPLDVVALPFKRMLQQMKSPSSKNWIAYGSPAWRAKNPESVQSNCLFPVPILNVSHSLVTRKDQAVVVDSVQSLFDQRLITLHGYNYPVLADYFDQGMIQKLDVKNHQSAFKAVAARRGLGFVGMNIRVAYSFSVGGIPRSEFELHDLSFLIPSYPIHLSYDCNMDADLQAKLIEHYQYLQERGQIDVVVARYLRGKTDSKM